MCGEQTDYTTAQGPDQGAPVDDASDGHHGKYDDEQHPERSAAPTNSPEPIDLG